VPKPAAAADREAGMASTVRRRSLDVQLKILTYH
jgi:hypothetical protein